MKDRKKVERPGEGDKGFGEKDMDNGVRDRDNENGEVVSLSGRMEN